MNILLTCYLGIRPGHAAVHPSSRFVFVVYETMSTLTWHQFKANGTIGEALGEVSSIDPTLKNAWFVGMSLNLAAEISCTATHVYVSNRGKALLLGKAENSLNLIWIRQY
jgi:6-phosphogluconolactonase (cycloisomerase 2 family)